VKAVIVGFPAMGLGTFCDVFVLPVVVLFAGLFATGKIPEYGGRSRLWRWLAYSVGRGTLALGAGFLAGLWFFHVGRPTDTEMGSLVENRALMVSVVYSVIVATVGYDMVLKWIAGGRDSKNKIN
jgi:hypothetical protein